MINKKLIFGLSALILGAGVFMLPGKVMAYQGDYTQKGPNCDPERHEAMEQAFENNDYQAWADLMEGRGRVTEVINESNFNRFAEAHRLAEEGNYDAADAIRAELGLRTRNGERTGSGYMRGMGQGRGQGLGINR
ncbi:hypothetical protein C4561_03350 [candidate division WWE3 bacterium]|jgi:hypothetical protein|uniref:Uncharacterized protein n=1 Tax=candidate division WWE3 bacterium TaxID=2053526 RepID=A0A3A4ZC99_UNCKA|nr:MAG: hypothetical protein C4561_03350 [candidate division WWE3 bacterium]